MGSNNNNDVHICMALVAMASWIVCTASAQTQPTCVPKLLPCQPFLHNKSPPPGSCCLPLMDLMENDLECLCAIFSNGAILKTFNVTQDEAFNLPKLCGRAADLAECKPNNSSDTAGSASSPPPSHPPPASEATSRGYLHALFFGWILCMAAALL